MAERGPQINRAVVTPDTRGVKPPGVSAPLPPHAAPRRGHIGLRELAVGAGAIATTGAAVAVGVNFLRQQGQSPDQTPLPGGIVEPSNSPIPTPFSTENPTITLPPSPEVTPSPTPSATPEATPVPSIEEVPITWPGYARFEDEQYRPYFWLDIENATVVAKEPIKNGKMLFAITLAADNKAGKIDVKCHKDTGVINAINMCVFTGATLWIQVDKGTRVADAGQYHTLLGFGPKFIDPYLKIGDKIDGIGILFGKDPYANGSATQYRMNRNSLVKLRASDGKKYPRSDRRFMFYGGGVTLDTPIL